MKTARNLGYILAIAVVLLMLALAFHYQMRLRLLEHSAVVIQPGKWVWVECQTHEFSATIEEVTTSGIVVFVAAPPPKGLPCKAVDITARDEHRYFLPFRTLLGVKIGEQEKWANPFSI